MYSTGNYTQYLAIAYNGKVSKKLFIYVYIHTHTHTHTNGSCCYKPETINKTTV